MTKVKPGYISLKTRDKIEQYAKEERTDKLPGDSSGTDCPDNGDSPETGRTFASIQRDGDLFLAHP